jgi:tetratricopeptide (TPR) repeat protein
VQEEIFAAPDFVVRYVGEQRMSCCVVTFYSLTNFSALDRPGFAEDFFLRHGIDAIHVINRTNAWYQYPQLTEALQKIKHRLSGYARIFTYGSSMGGYAAYRFADAIGAQVAIVLSAQYSFLPRKVPFESRWGPLRRNIEPIIEDAFPPEKASCRVIHFYDSRDADREHARLIAEHYPTTHVCLPHGGHPAGIILSETGLLPSAILNIIEGTFDPGFFEQSAWARRRSSGQYLSTLARRLLPIHARAKLFLAEAAVKASGGLEYMIYFALLLEKAGRTDDAETQFKQAMAISPPHPNAIRALCLFMLRSGRLQEAAGLAAKLLEADPACAEYLKFHKILHVKKAGQHELPSRSIAAVATSIWRDLAVFRLRKRHSLKNEILDIEEWRERRLERWRRILRVR